MTEFIIENPEIITRLHIPRAISQDITVELDRIPDLGLLHKISGSTQALILWRRILWLEKRVLCIGYIKVFVRLVIDYDLDCVLA